MKKLSLFIQLLPLLITADIYAANITIGKPLPNVNINDSGRMIFDYKIEKGQMVCDKESFSPKYKPWNSTEQKGKISIIFHIAARMGMYQINEDFVNAIVEAHFPDKLPHSPLKMVTIVNADDAIWGTSFIAVSKFKKVQQRYPYYLYVLDNNGVASSKWALQKENSAVIITDKEGVVVFFKEGKLSTTEIQTALTRITHLLE